MFEPIPRDPSETSCVPAVRMLAEQDIELAVTTQFGQPTVQQAVNRTMLSWHFKDTEARGYLLVGRGEDWAVYGPDSTSVGGFTHWLGNMLQRVPHLLGQSAR